MLQSCHRFLLLFLFTGTLAVRALYAQGPMPSRSAAELQAMLNRTQVLGSVLYVAAHPDDENTRLITYLARGKGYRTAYLSLTRGDGGQNLIGSEAGPALGVLRTQELLAARRVDGGEQMFSRAYDFGYSKNPEETFRIWGKDSILADVVWAIRKFKPDVIITRFPGPEKGGGGHGHHTASAMLAQEAFAMAADPAAFPEQLKYVSVWQAKRLLWNAWQPQGGVPALENLISVEIGGFDPLLGRSYGEIAAEARSMHRCQAFGVARVRGSVTEFLQHEKGEQAKTDLFEGINTTWERVEGGDAVQKWLLKAWQSFDPAHPELIVPYLSKALLTMEGKEGYWYEVKRREIQELLLYCAGIWMEVNSSAPAVAQGDSADLTAFIIKRSNAAVTLKSIYFGYPGETNPWNAPLKSSQTMETAKRKFIVRD
ncbi:MAG: PIG-L family deacetylase, partial [Bacteroidetes bacterium]